MGDAGNLVSASTVKSSSQGTETIWKAAAYGELSAVQGFIAEEKALVYKADEQGFHPLQWAALNNRTDVVTCLLGEGAQVNAVDHTGQTALHWAAVRGSLSAAEALLRSSADIQIRDCRGYTVAHVASQYGQTALLYHLALRWEVDVEGGDNDGRTCLQWAAYKGFADTIRLLLVLDAHVEHADKEGCTALHWAAIRGNGEACTILMQAGAASLLTTKDITGCTPAELASEKGHRFLANYLRDYKEKEDGHQRLCGKAGALSWLTSTQLCPIIWLIIVSLVALFIHKVVQNSSFPELGGLTTSMAWACVTCASAGLVLLYRITVADPGFLPRSTGSSSAARSSALSKASPSKALKQPLDQLLGRKKLESSNRDSEDSSERLTEYRQLDSPALWAGNWTQLCVSCKIVRPLRAKHCSVTDRCVEQFDHYCPWGCVAWNIYYIYFKLLKLVMICYLYLLMAIGGSPLFSHYLASWKMAGKHVKFTHEVGNTIGKGNRFKFLAFLIIETVAMSCGLAVAILRIHQASKAKKPSQGIPWIFLFIFGDGFLLIGVTALMVTQASQIARNITTNELANWPRYKYLRKADGAFFNPFDRGCRENCIETAYPSQHPTAPAVLEDSILESAPLMQEAACRSGCKHYN